MSTGRMYRLEILEVTGYKPINLLVGSWRTYNLLTYEILKCGEFFINSTSIHHAVFQSFNFVEIFIFKL